MKHYLAGLALAVLVLTGVGYYTQQEKESEFLFQRDFYNQFEMEDFEQFQEDSNDLESQNKLQGGHHAQNYPAVLSYKISHSLEVNQSPHDLEHKIQARHITIDAECEVQAAHDSRRHTIEFAVSYSKIEKKGDEFDLHKLQANEQQFKEGEFIFENVSQNSKGEIYEGEKQEENNIEVKIQQDRFFKVLVQETSGKIISIKGEANVQEDEHLTWITEMLINDLMPETRRYNYNKRVQEQNSLGKVNALLTSSSQSGKLKIVKQWTDKDIKKYNINLPQMNYRREVLVYPQGGKVYSGKTSFDFSVGRQGLMSLESGIEVESAGEMYGHIRQNIQQYTNSREDMRRLSKEMMRYRKNAEFQDYQLSVQKVGSFGMGTGAQVNFQTQPFTEKEAHSEVSSGSNNYFVQSWDGTRMQNLQQAQEEELVEVMWPQQEQEQLLQQEEEEEEQIQNLRASQLVYTSTSKLGSVKIFGSHIHVDLTYNAYKDSQQITVKCMVNKHTIQKLLDLKWNNCKDVNSDVTHDRKFTLFKAVFPLMGIINIPVSASAKFHYGYKKQFEGGPGSCKFTLMPHFEGELYADGKVSVLGIIDAGIYSTGKFLDVDLKFLSSQNKRNLSSSLTGDFKAFELDIGVTYSKYNCSPKRWFKSGYEEEENQVSLQQDNRRKLLHVHVGKHLKKLGHKIHKFVKKAKKVVKVVAKVVRNGVNGIIEAFCQRKQGYKQIVHHHQKPHKKTLFNKYYNI